MVPGREPRPQLRDGARHELGDALADLLAGLPFALGWELGYDVSGQPRVAVDAVPVGFVADGVVLASVFCHYADADEVEGVTVFQELSVVEVLHDPSLDRVMCSCLGKGGFGLHQSGVVLYW